MGTKRKFTVTVTNVSTIEVEAEDRDQAIEIAEKKLIDDPTEDLMQEVLENSCGWAATDAEEA